MNLRADLAQLGIIAKVDLVPEIQFENADCCEADDCDCDCDDCECSDCISCVG